MARLLPDWLDSYLTFTKNTEPSTLYKKWCGISTIAACLQRRVWLNWIFDEPTFANLYVVLVGPSAARKGSAMGPAMRMLRDIGVPMCVDATTAQALVHRLIGSVLSFQNIKTGEIILHNSLTAFSPEFSVLLGHQNIDLLTHLTDWYDCREPWIRDTRSHGEERVERVWMNLIGATTPMLLNDSLIRLAAGAGLTSRIIFVYADGKEQTIPFSVMTKEEEKLRNMLIEDLNSMLVLTGPFQYTPSFTERYVKWYEQSDRNPPFRDYHLEHYLGRRATHMRKLSMLFSASRSSELVLDSIDFDGALALLVETERIMPRVFMGVGKADNAELFPRLMGAIASQREVSVGKLLELFYRDMTREELGTMLQVLASIEPPFIILEYRGEGRSKTLYAIYKGA